MQYSNLAKMIRIGLLSLSVTSCGGAMRHLKPGYHYAMLTGCDVLDGRQHTIICNTGKGEKTITVGKRLAYFEELDKSFELKTYVVVPNVSKENAEKYKQMGIISEKDPHSIRAMESHKSQVKWLADYERNGKSTNK